MTALEFLNEYQEDKLILQSLLEDGPAFYNSAQGAIYITDVMVEFAQFHVQEALKKASEGSKLHPLLEEFLADSWESQSPIDKDSILNSYPIENIKSY